MMTPAATNEHSTVSLSALADEFVQHGANLRNWSPQTVRSYRQWLAQLPIRGPSQR